MYAGATAHVCAQPPHSSTNRCAIVCDTDVQAQFASSCDHTQADACSSEHSNTLQQPLIHTSCCTSCMYTQVPAVDAAATTTSSNSSRRNLLLGLSGAAALTASQLLLLQPAPAAADEGFTSVIGDDEPETTSAAPDAAATPPAPAAVEQPAATPGSSGRLSQVTTPVG